ncbi:MAG: EamA family transporter [Actinobacteria bacterium]|nr:EamA family transporter [Actinomycetota bacterium]
MTRSYPVLLFFLAAVWGASYLFIKVAVDEIEPAAMMGLRLVIAASLLVAFLFVERGVRRSVQELRGASGDGLVLGIVNAALPFTLIAWGEQHIDSGIAAIANATVPLFVVLLAIRFQPSERVSTARFGGILLGLAGVAVLAGANPDGGWWAAAGTLAVVASSLCYASGSLLGQRRVAETPGPVLATASMIGGALVLVPFALLQLPGELPGWKALGSVVALAVLGTTLAQLVLFRMLRLHGSARTSLVTYLLPPTALLYGALLLDEPLTGAVLAGLGLILAGVAVGSGALGLQRPRPEPAPRRT